MARRENKRNTDAGGMDRSSMTSNRFGFDVGNQYDDSRFIDRDYNLGNGASMRRDYDSDFDMNGDSQRDRDQGRRYQRDLSGSSRPRKVNRDIINRHYGRNEGEDEGYNFSDDWDRDFTMNGPRDNDRVYGSRRFRGARDRDEDSFESRNRPDETADYSGYYGDANANEHLGTNRFGSGRPASYNDNRFLDTDDNFINTQTGRGFDRNVSRQESWRGGNSSNLTGQMNRHFDDMNDRVRGTRGTNRGEFFGKGPKGWKRSDDRIREDVCEALFHSDEVDASEIEVKVKDGEIFLSGTVDSREAKREAERCLEELRGVQDVHNQLRVNPQSNVKDLRKEGPDTGRAANFS